MNKYFINLVKEPIDLQKGAIICYHPNLLVEASISASRPGIEITLDKVERKNFSKPVSTKYHTVKPVLKDEYDKCLRRNLQLITTPDWADAEYYLQTYSEVLELAMFTINIKSQFYINVRLCDEFDYGSVEVNRDSSFSRRREFRSRGTAIEESQFRNILQLVCAYILDEVNFINLSAKAKLLLNGEMIASEVTAANTQAYINQLEQKKEQIKSRLIGNDSDTPLERATLRGELTGIEYALQVYYLSQ